MMKATFEVDLQKVEEINKLILILDGIATGGKQHVALTPKELACPAQGSAAEAAKEATDKMKPPTPAVKKLLDAAGIQESEYGEIPRTGKNNNITQGDAKAYISMKEARAKQAASGDEAQAWPTGVPAAPGAASETAPASPPPAPPATPAPPPAPPAAEAPAPSTREFPAAIPPATTGGGIPNLPDAPGAPAAQPPASGPATEAAAVSGIAAPGAQEASP